ncbi:16S rRNA (cytidine(1402)-2'-O)-methyltransferase [Mobiluncus mulieris]|uniref:Ribosomal RNA small subunit methyltransferase I n=1 Tax=Mobiluncus mulieris TaxID=2052 RepID=A0A7Y0U2Z7_9ACTO|nr:16S rRNA (cytidine(1402)-2'-O)-methyltransferase [Mobiluncus mulieris]NMW65964.1 16S rRNA (cytidine(1402)-2'-O)-methyltransferase [Mobiluncus mulieris]
MMNFPSPFETVSLVLAATPIGNLGDASPRLVQALLEAEVLACEDTRRLRDLARRLELNLSGQLLAYHEHNEAAVTEDLLTAARQGTKVLQVTDAGMPGISDPGFCLARAATRAAVPYTVLPGPSAPLLALVASGLPTDSFRFCGFLPRKITSLYQTLQSLSADTSTLIFLESPRRVLATLVAFLEIFGANRPAVLARELTKIHEELLGSTLGEIHANLASRDEVRGEIVLVVSGAPAHETTEITPEILEKLDQLVQNGMRAKDGAKLLSQWFKVGAKALYETHITRQHDS